MENKTLEAPSEVWDRLSEDAQRLVIALATGGGLSQEKDFLEFMSQDPDGGFNLDKGMEELFSLGLLQQVTQIQEMRERLASMPRPREIILTPLGQVPPGRLKEYLNPTDSERKYLRLTVEIKEHEANREKYPDHYKGGEEPRFRLSPEFRGFIETIFKEE